MATGGNPQHGLEKSRRATLAEEAALPFFTLPAPTEEGIVYMEVEAEVPTTAQLLPCIYALTIRLYIRKCEEGLVNVYVAYVEPTVIAMMILFLRPES